MFSIISEYFTNIMIGVGILLVYFAACCAIAYLLFLPLEQLGAVVSIGYIVALIATQIISDWYFQVNKK